MSQFLPIALAVMAGSYLIGSLSFAVIVSKLLGLTDPRTYGSGNPGATNVLRSGSKVAAGLTLLLDALKGFVPVLVVRCVLESGGVNYVALAALGAFLGHLYPIFFKFKGGKGVATALGVFLAINGYLGLFLLLTWLLVALLSRYSSLAAVLCAVCAPIYYMFGSGVLWYGDKHIALSISAMSVLLLWRHAQNIDRLLRGEESKIGKKKGANK